MNNPVAITEPSVVVPATTARRLLPLIKRATRDAIFNGGVIRPEIVAVVEAFEAVATSDRGSRLESVMSRPSVSREELLSSAQAAEVIGVTDRQVRSLAHRGTLKGEMVGARWAFHRIDIEAYVRRGDTDGRAA